MIDSDVYIERQMPFSIGDPKQLPTISEIIDTFGYRNYKLLLYGQEHNIHEYLTDEYMQGLGAYLIDRIKAINQETKRNVLILEIGAGDGKLSHFLQYKYLRPVSDICSVIASDNGSFGIKPLFPVVRSDYREALIGTMPDIVFCSWMCKNQDWTPAIRKCSSVKEYILLGDTDLCGTCDTYGIGEGGKWIGIEDGAFEFRNPEGYIAPHQQDNFVMTNLINLSRIQICVSDTEAYHPKSRTLSFRRSV